MTRLLAVLVLGIAFVAVSSRLSAAQGAVPDSAHKAAISRTVLTYFRALQGGNVVRLKDYLSEEEYRQYKVLLEQNREYPRFLKDFYRGASFHVGDVVRHEDHTIINVTISRPSGNSSFTLLLKQDLAGRWRIGQHAR